MASTGTYGPGEYTVTVDLPSADDPYRPLAPPHGGDGAVRSRSFRTRPASVPPSGDATRDPFRLIHPRATRSVAGHDQ